MKKRKVIIIEGHDKAGKSSIIEEMRKHLYYFTVCYFGKLDKKFRFFPDYLYALYGGRPDDVLILDRFFMSEMAYGKACRRGMVRIEPKEVRALILILKKCFDVTYVSCICRKVMDEIDETDVVKRSQFDKLCDEYMEIEHWMEAHGFRVLPYDRSVQGLSEFTSMLVEDTKIERPR